MNDMIYFKLFGGGISYRTRQDEEWTRLEDAATGGVGKKLASFLEYLIVNHGKDISSEELIAQFWPEDSSNDPASALKYTMHKTRALLKNIFPEKENLLVTMRGYYTWNADVEIILDLEEFEKAYQEAKQSTGEEAVEYMMDAIELYSGDLLTNNDSEWIQSLRIYYRTLYIDACKSALAQLKETDSWIDIIQVCEKAYTLEPTAEEFTLSMMGALVALNQPARALEQYNTYKRMLWSDLNLVPSEKVEQARAMAEEAANQDEEDILSLLKEEEPDASAFLCSFSVFRSIVMLESRHLERHPGESCVLVVKATAPKNESTGTSVPTTDVRRVEKTLLRGLRAADPVARLNAGTYVVLLSGATEENSHTVMERIERMFRHAYPRSKAYLSYKVYKL